MINRKPTLEKIEPPFGSSFHIQRFDNEFPNKLPEWHFHPELELVFVNGGSGKRHIGNQLSYFDDGDLILIGPNLPHFGFTDRLTANKAETIIQMRKDFLGIDFLNIPEMKSLKLLIERSQSGIVFYGDTKIRVGEMMEELLDLEPTTRLIHFLKLLQILAGSNEYKILNVDSPTFEFEPQDTVRINSIYQFVRANFKRHISLDEMAEKVNMTVPAFCRYFKKFSGKTFTQFVNEYRLVHAVKLLSEGQSSITTICFECGFNNFSHFNKQFKNFTGKNPSHYRRELKKVIS